MKRFVLLVVALGLGFFITWVDSRPNWDDTGVTALAIFLCCCLLGAIESSRPWLWALAVGMWIPLSESLSTVTSALCLLSWLPSQAPMPARESAGFRGT